MTTKKLVVFTDVDGTLLDSKYSFHETESIVRRLIAVCVAIVLVSSKTRVELEYYRKQLGILDPFISENGAAIFIPKGYFKNLTQNTKQSNQYHIIELGIPYPNLREKLKAARKKAGCRAVGFGDLSVEEVAYDAGLPLELAALAKQREYTEPIRSEEKCTEMLFDYAEEEGLSFVKGDRYVHITGDHDKGKAVSVLKSLYTAEFGGLESFGVGNGPNDLSMLRATNHPFFIGAPSERKIVWDTIIADAMAQR